MIILRLKIACWNALTLSFLPLNTKRLGLRTWLSMTIHLTRLTLTQIKTSDAGSPNAFANNYLWIRAWGERTILCTKSARATTLTLTTRLTLTSSTSWKCWIWATQCRQPSRCSTATHHQCLRSMAAPVATKQAAQRWPLLSVSQRSTTKVTGWLVIKTQSASPQMMKIASWLETSTTTRGLRNASAAW